MENMDMEKNAVPTGGEPASMQPPVAMPTPTPEPTQAPVSAEAPVMPPVEPMAPVQPPVEMPTPAPMPTPEPTQAPVSAEAPVMPPAEPMTPVQPPVEMPTQAPQQQMGSMPAIERVEMSVDSPMQPIDLSAQGMEQPIGTPVIGGSKKMYIIIGVVIAGLLAGVGGFFVWRMMNAPAEEIPATEQSAEIEVPQVQPIVTPVVPEVDDMSIIEQELNAFGSTNIDTELQGELDAINASL